MKASITSTDRIVEVSDPTGRRARARVWEGETGDGVHFVLYVVQTQVQGRGSAEFDRDLVKSGPASREAMVAIDMRYVV